jgi:CRISPR-associated protein Csm3
MKFLGKIIIQAELEAKTGLRVGGSSGGLKIGGVDLNVITDAFGVPYIPGSSLKGKMRSLMEHKDNVPLNANKNSIHLCTRDEDYAKCPICQVWGTMADKNSEGFMLTRLYCRDASLDLESITEKMKQNQELAWTEVKYETAIDRKKGTALRGALRQIERVPAGARFKTEFIFNVFGLTDKALLKKVFEAMALLEDDYLGGMGSRGYGKVGFSNLKIWWNKAADYESGKVSREDSRIINKNQDTLSGILQNYESIIQLGE